MGSWMDQIRVNDDDRSSRRLSNNSKKSSSNDRVMSGTAATTAMQSVLASKASGIEKAAYIIAARLRGLDDSVVDTDKCVRLINDLLVGSSRDEAATWTDNDKVLILTRAIAIYMTQSEYND